MNIIKLKPKFKQYIWGGSNINKIYGKETPEPPVAESWEISGHPDGLSTVDGGTYNGMTIPELCKKFGKEFYGESMMDKEDFPFLFKILDAENDLSIQVHPDDKYAFEHEAGSKGKTEAWYILHAEEGSQLIYGFKENVSKEQYLNAIKDGTLENILNRVDCKNGDVFYIPSGMVHAVGKGLLIAEIQQSSNTTYRVYDYNRKDKDGNLRELHIDKAIDVSNLESSLGNEKIKGCITEIGKTKIRKFIDNEFFHFDEISVLDEFSAKTNNRLHMLFVAEGSLFINDCEYTKGDSLILPACIENYNIKGQCVILRFW